jgi:hypothetical protein
MLIDIIVWNEPIWITNNSMDLRPGKSHIGSLRHEWIGKTKRQFIQKNVMNGKLQQDRQNAAIY